MLATFDSDGRPTAFRPESLGPLPGLDMEQISDADYRELLSNQRTKRYVDGKVVTIDPKARRPRPSKGIPNP